MLRDSEWSISFYFLFASWTFGRWKSHRQIAGPGAESSGCLLRGTPRCSYGPGARWSGLCPGGLVLQLACLGKAWNSERGARPLRSFMPPGRPCNSASCNDPSVQPSGHLHLGLETCEKAQSSLPGPRVARRLQQPLFSVCWDASFWVAALSVAGQQSGRMQDKRSRSSAGPFC